MSRHCRRCLLLGWRRLTSGDMGLFTGPHHTFSFEPASSTIRLSEGERPVFAPEYADRAPLDVIAEPVSYTRASSYSAGTDGLAIWKGLSTRCPAQSMGGVMAHDSNAVIVDVSLVMEFVFQLGVLLLRPVVL